MLKILLNILLMLLLVGNTTVTTAQDITVYLSAIDVFDGKSLNAEYRAKSLNTGRAYTLKVENEERYFDLKKNDEVKISVVLDGYYPEELMLKGSDILGYEVDKEFKLNRRPTAILLLQATEPTRNKPIDANFEVYLGSKLIGRGSTSKNNNQYKLLLNEKGAYKVVTTSPKFASTSTIHSIEVNTPPEKYVETIGFKPKADKVLVKFVEERTGNSLEPKVTIVNSTTGETLYDKKPKKGVLDFIFQQGVTYNLKADSDGFQTMVKNLEGPVFEDLKFVMKALTEVRFTAKDAVSGKVLKVDFEVLLDDGSKVVVKDKQSFIPPRKGNYRAKPILKGYRSKSDGFFTINNLSAGVLNEEHFLEVHSAVYTLKVIDKYSKKPITNAEVKAFSQNGLELSGTKTNGNGEWQISINSEAKHFIEVRAEEYSDLTKNLSSEGQGMQVEMTWKPELTYKLCLVDKKTDQAISEATLKVKRSNGKELFLYKTKEKGKYLAKINKGEALFYIISSEKYQETVVSISNWDNNTQNLYLEKNEVTEVFLIFEDALTGRKLKPQYRVTKNGNIVEVVNDRLKVDDKGEFNLNAKLNKYKDLFIQDLNKLTGSVIQMERKTYPLVIAIKGLLKPSDIERIRLSLKLDQNSEIAYSKGKSSTFMANVPLTGSYSIDIQNEGYQNFTKTFALKELAIRNEISYLEVELIPKMAVNNEKSIKTQTKPIKTNTAQASVATTPNNEIQAFLRKVPTSKEDLVQELTSNESVGKRYLLDQVSFDQGSPQIRVDNVPQLDVIAEALKAHPSIEIEIIGHTDNVGDPRRNLGLSTFRAKAVSNYLFNQGADPDKVKVKGKGDTEPLVPNDTEENKIKNRRVEMILTDN